LLFLVEDEQGPTSPTLSILGRFTSGTCCKGGEVTSGSNSSLPRTIVDDEAEAVGGWLESSKGKKTGEL
jgi:hypothetical protein